MTHDIDGCRAYVVHLQDEHRRLRELVREVQRVFFGDEASATEPARSLQPQLQALRVELARHFFEEEQGGCVDEAVARRPTLAAEAREVEDEHPVLLGHLDRIIEQTPSLAPESVRTLFSDFAECLLTHEARETRLIEQGFNIYLETDGPGRKAV